MAFPSRKSDSFTREHLVALAVQKTKLSWLVRPYLDICNIGDLNIDCFTSAVSAGCLWLNPKDVQHRLSSDIFVLLQPFHCIFGVQEQRGPWNHIPLAAPDLRILIWNLHPGDIFVHSVELPVQLAPVHLDCFQLHQHVLSIQGNARLYSQIFGRAKSQAALNLQRGFQRDLRALLQILFLHLREIFLNFL